MKSRSDYFKQYNRENRVRISLNFNKHSEKDIIEAIDREDPENRGGAIKSLIRKGMLYDNQQREK